MITNLLVNGASFTANTSWATYVAQQCNLNLVNLAAGGAGNQYITNSTQDYILEHAPDPKTTLVLIMWGGTGNIDWRISGEWWYYLKDNNYKIGSHPVDSEDSYYVFSGGMGNSWTEHSTAKKIFEWQYKLSDPIVLCKQSLLHFINLENFLHTRGYRYRFISPGNMFKVDQPEFYAGNYSIGYFCKDLKCFKNFDYSNWIFADAQKNGLSEFAHSIGQMKPDYHPTDQGHDLFAQQIIIPEISKLLV